MKKTLLGAQLIVAGLLLTACSGAGAIQSPLVAVGASGGMCVEASCDSSYTVYDDGSVEGLPNVQVNTTELKKAIASTELNTLEDDPEAFCQSFVDGQDLTIRVYSFGSEIYKPCELKGAASDPLVKEAETILEKIREAEQTP